MFWPSGDFVPAPGALARPSWPVSFGVQWVAKACAPQQVAWVLGCWEAMALGREYFP